VLFFTRRSHERVVVLRGFVGTAGSLAATDVLATLNRPQDVRKPRLAIKSSRYVVDGLVISQACVILAPKDGGLSYKTYKWRGSRAGIAWKANN